MQGEKHLKITTPITTNGTNLAIGEDGRVMYKETIVASTARPHFERLNNSLPKQLQHKIEDYEEPKEPVKK